MPNIPPSLNYNYNYLFFNNKENKNTGNNIEDTGLKIEGVNNRGEVIENIEVTKGIEENSNNNST